MNWYFFVVLATILYPSSGRVCSPSAPLERSPSALARCPPRGASFCCWHQRAMTGSARHLQWPGGLKKTNKKKKTTFNYIFSINHISLMCNKTIIYTPITCQFNTMWDVLMTHLLQVFAVRLELGHHRPHAALHWAQCGLSEQKDSIFHQRRDNTKKNKKSQFIFEWALAANLVRDITKGEVGEGHAGVAPQRDAVVVTAQPAHLAVYLQQFGHSLQPSCNRTEEKQTDRQKRINTWQNNLCIYILSFPLTKFVHGMSMLLIEGKFHKDTDGWTNLMLHWRWHWSKKETNRIN